MGLICGGDGQDFSFIFECTGIVAEVKRNFVAPHCATRGCPSTFRKESQDTPVPKFKFVYWRALGRAEGQIFAPRGWVRGAEAMCAGVSPCSLGECVHLGHEIGQGEADFGVGLILSVKGDGDLAVCKADAKGKIRARLEDVGEDSTGS